MPQLKKIDWKNNFDFNALIYSPPKPGKHGNSTSAVGYRIPGQDKVFPLLLQGPQMKLPFGVKLNNLKDPPGYSVDMGFNGVSVRTWQAPVLDANNNPIIMDVEGDKVPQMKEYHEYTSTDQNSLDFLNFLEQLDQKNKAMCLKHSVQWGRKQVSRELVDTFYKPIIRMQKAPYPPNFGCGTSFWKGQFTTEFYYSNGKQITNFDEIVSIPKHSIVIPLVETSGLWFTATQFGMKFKCVQLVVFPYKKSQGLSIDTTLYYDALTSPENVEVMDVDYENNNNNNSLNQTNQDGQQEDQKYNMQSSNFVEAVLPQNTMQNNNVSPFTSNDFPILGQKS